MVNGVGSTLEAVKDFNRQQVSDMAQKSAQSPTVTKEIQSNNPEGTGSKINIYV
ncbi:MAG: hypothetical protein HQK97_08245 [Nitrospirae bacterium]|nr:hypothetical protein [Nitrospirota bacterium]